MEEELEVEQLWVRGDVVNSVCVVIRCGLDVFYKSALELEETLAEKWLCSLFWLGAALVFNSAVKRKGKKGRFFMWWCESLVSHEQLCSRMCRDLFIKMILASHPNAVLLLQELMFLSCCLLHSYLTSMIFFFAVFSPNCLSCRVHVCR